MTSLQKYKQLMTEMSEFSLIANALKEISLGQVVLKKKLAVLAEEIVFGLRAATFAVPHSPKKGKELHIMISCDQRFCRSFLIPLNHFLEKIATILFDGEGEFEYMFYSDNQLSIKEEDGEKVIDDTEPYCYKVEEVVDIYSPKDTHVDILICGAQSSKLADEFEKDEGVNFFAQKTIKSFTEAKEIAAMSERYDEVYIHGYYIDKYDLDTDYVSYKSGFKNAFQPILHLAEEIFMFASASSFKENSVRSQVMSEAADNSKKEAKLALLKYNKCRQTKITESTLQQ